MVSKQKNSEKVGVLPGNLKGSLKAHYFINLSLMEWRMKSYRQAVVNSDSLRWRVE